MMDITCQIRQQYEGVLQQLAQTGSQLSRARGKQKKDLESQLDQNVKNLLQRVQKDWLSQMSQVVVLTALYQETGLTSETVANAIRAAWQQQVVRQQAQDVLGEQSTTWNVSKLLNDCAKPAPDLSKLPSGSWFLQFDFTLAKPYISHDDESNYLIDNPVTKDHVFGLPMIRPMSWKGNLRSALCLHKGWKEDDASEMVGLFGNPKGSESDFRAGRLVFFPTFFHRIGLEIINPHRRDRKVGRNPILLECVPADAKGTFNLLYVPFDLIGKHEAEIHRQAADDLKLVAEAVREMMLVYGFSAKRSSGYGVAKDGIEGKIKTRAEEKSLKRLSQIGEEVQNVAW